MLPYVSQRARLLPALALFIFASPGIFPPPGRPPARCWLPSPGPAVPLRPLCHSSRRDWRSVRPTNPMWKWGRLKASPVFVRTGSVQGGHTRPLPADNLLLPQFCILTDRRVLVDRTWLRWGRRSSEWRWRAIALATAGCAYPLRVPGGCCPIDPPAPLPIPHLHRHALPLPAGLRGHSGSARIPVPPALLAHGPLVGARCGGATLEHPKVWVCLPLGSSRWPRCTRVVLNANLTSQRGRRGTTYAQ